MSTFETETPRTGRWIRRGRNIVLPDPWLPGEHSSVQEVAAWAYKTGASSTTDVAWVQRSLNQVMGSRLDVDGVMGPYTRAAVVAFQQRKGLAADGIPGPITKAALQTALAGTPSAGAPYGPLLRTIVEAGRYIQSRYGYRVSEHPAFGGVSPRPVHKPNSCHYSNLAIDVNSRAGTSSAEQAELNALAADLQKRCVVLKNYCIRRTSRAITVTICISPCRDRLSSDPSFARLAVAWLQRTYTSLNSLMDVDNARVGRPALPELDG